MVLGSSLHTETDLIITPPNVESLYGELNLANASLFSGGFINFGYWKNLKIDSPIPKRIRSLSSRRLYEEVFNALALNNADSVLEIGCGLGNGCVLLNNSYSPKYVLGIDSSIEQINRAIHKHRIYLSKHSDSIRFAKSSAENILIEKGSISKAFSVEAMQHFYSINDFLESIFCVLKENGKLVIATFFFLKDPSVEFMHLFPNFSDGIDKVIKLQEFRKNLEMHGFCKIRSRSIGKHVWSGFDKWISQTEYKDTWDKNWIKAYQNGIIDYFIIEAEKGS